VTPSEGEEEAWAGPLIVINATDEWTVRYTFQKRLTTGKSSLYSHIFALQSLPKTEVAAKTCTNCFLWHC
jgi:hypothetical protein